MDTQVLFYEGALEQVDGTWKLMGSKCACCGYVAYPAKERCPICGGDSTEHVELSSTGTVYSFNIVRVPVGRFRPPMIGGLIDLPEGVRLYTQIRGPESSIHAGMPVKMEVGPLYTDADGNEVLGFYCLPEEKGVCASE